MIIGLVGKPSSGKSTFFKAATLAEVAIAPYPFTTIDKNEGIAFVKTECVDSELKVKCQPRFGYCKQGIRFIPTKLIDVAGLVPGAHAGKGRGNQFLDDLREADILIHIVDASGKTNAEGNPTEDYNVLEEVKFLQEEIDLWLYAMLEKKWASFSRRLAQEGKLGEELAKQLSGLKVTEDAVIRVMKHLNLSESVLKWKKEDILAFASGIRKEAKPIIIAANKADTKTAEANIKKLKEKFPEILIIPCSAESELALREAAKHELIDYTPGDSSFEMKGQLSEQQKKALAFVQESVLEKYGNTGVQQCLNAAIFDFLGMVVAYPVDNESKMADKYGKVLPDAFLMPRGSTALDFAEKIHTDFAKTFGGAIDAKTKKRLARDYKVKDKDVLKIITKDS